MGARAGLVPTITSMPERVFFGNIKTVNGAKIGFQMHAHPQKAVCRHC
jgi:hypothetical protein